MSTEVWQVHQWFTAEAVSVSTSLGLDYEAGHVAPPFQPTEDDQQTRNDVTARRPRGSSFRFVQETGPLSALDPPTGVGRYDESVEVNVETDLQLRDQASWRVHLGTVDEPRYPKLGTDLHRNTDLVEQVSGIDSGDRATVANVPLWLPPGDAETIVQGYSETHTPFVWKWSANTTPGSPWDVAVLDSPVLGRLDTAGSELSTSITDTQTSFDVVTTAISPWIDGANFPTEFPFDIRVGGELMTVTDIAGTSSPQTFTVTRSVNSVVKSHDAGSAVNVDRPATLAL